MRLNQSIQTLSTGILAFVLSSCAGLSGPAQPLSTGILTADPARAKQIIEVTPVNNTFKARLSAWSYDQGFWHKIFGPWPVVIGRNGFAMPNNKKEGDGKTPSGIYPVSLAFGKDPVLKTGLAYRQATVHDVWVDDPASAQYNQWVSGKPQASSFETMRRPDGIYDIGAVIEYNTSPVIPGKGSAIFMHIWREHGQKPTAGCVALNSRNLRHLLAWLNAGKLPVIILDPVKLQP